jgi:hypothetical protein
VSRGSGGRLARLAVRRRVTGGGEGQGSSNKTKAGDEEDEQVDEDEDEDEEPKDMEAEFEEVKPCAPNPKTAGSSAGATKQPACCKWPRAEENQHVGHRQQPRGGGTSSRRRERRQRRWGGCPWALAAAERRRTGGGRGANPAEMSLMRPLLSRLGARNVTSLPLLAPCPLGQTVADVQSGVCVCRYGRGHKSTLASSRGHRGCTPWASARTRAVRTRTP